MDAAQSDAEQAGMAVDGRYRSILNGDAMRIEKLFIRDPWAGKNSLEGG